MPEKLHEELLKSTVLLADDLRNYIITNKLQGQVLHRITGRLAGSIQRKISDSPTKIEGMVYSNDTAAPYNAAHEYGTVIHHPGNTPYIVMNDGAHFISNTAAESLLARGHRVFRTAPHTITLPERSYMRSSLSDKKDAIIKEYNNAAVRATK